MNPISVESIDNLHRNSIIRWKNSGHVDYQEQGFLALAEENHAFNFQLWQAEDKARRDDKGPEFVYEAKRAIDSFNQQRNDRMEAMDTWLFQALKPVDAVHCPVHSETPGMMIDRLSILALKAYHMQLQTVRQEVSESHRMLCQQKVVIINKQQKQLSHCLQELLQDIIAHRRTFRVYHQLKMYNDPKLNPELYMIKKQ